MCVDSLLIVVVDMEMIAGLILGVEIHKRIHLITPEQTNKYSIRVTTMIVLKQQRTTLDTPPICLTSATNTIMRITT